MTELTFITGDVKQDLRGDYEVILRVPKGQKSAVESFYNSITDNDKPMVAKIARKANRRSLDANAYLWVICQKIADKVQKNTKEDIYMEAVRKVGVFEIIPIRDDALEFWVRSWNARGLGWHSEVMHKAKTLPGYTVTMNYYGSSVYDVPDMAKLIDYIVDEAKELGVETMTPEEIERLKREWEGMKNAG